MALTFGDYLRVLRINASLKMREAAESIGISVPYWSDVENGKRNPFNGGEA